jgi:hypothetical protein
MAAIKSNLLSYGLVERPHRRKWVIRFAICVGGISALYAAACVKVTTRREMDQITGSTREQTLWNFGFKTVSDVQVSPLEVRLKKMGIQSAANWQWYGTTEWSMLGSTRACGSVPAIYRLLSLMQVVVDASTDSEIRDLVRVLQSGTDAQQKAAVLAWQEVGFGRQEKLR